MLTLESQITDKASNHENYSYEAHAQAIYQLGSGNLSKGRVHPIRYDGLALRHPLRFTLKE